MPNKQRKPEYIIPVNPSRTDSISTSTPSVSANNLGDMEDLESQHRFMDSLRSTDGIDYELVRTEAKRLLQLRKDLESNRNMSEFRSRGKKMCPYFAVKFPQFFDAIRTVELPRLDEFETILHLMLNKLNDVKNNIISHTDMRNQVFETELANRYYKRSSS